MELKERKKLADGGVGGVAVWVEVCTVAAEGLLCANFCQEHLA